MSGLTQKLAYGQVRRAFLESRSSSSSAVFPLILTLVTLFPFDFLGMRENQHLLGFPISKPHKCSIAYGTAIRFRKFGWVEAGECFLID